MWKEALLIGPSRIFTLYEILIFTIFVVAKGGGGGGKSGLTTLALPEGSSSLVGFKGIWLIFRNPRV